MLSVEADLAITSMTSLTFVVFLLRPQSVVVVVTCCSGAMFLLLKPASWLKAVTVAELI
jgi:hypothetical protein